VRINVGVPRIVESVSNVWKRVGHGTKAAIYRRSYLESHAAVSLEYDSISCMPIISHDVCLEFREVLGASGILISNSYSVT
jgi:hypothetical protein